MKKTIFKIVLVAVLALICAAVAAACVKNSYQLQNSQCDFAFIADPGSSEGSVSVSAIKEGETRTYDVFLHNGYNRATLKVYADGKQLTITPNANFKDGGVALNSGYQVVGSVNITASGKNVDIKFECEGKDFEIGFAAYSGYDENDPKLDLFAIDGAPLKDYLSGEKKLKLNFADVKDTFSFEFTGPVFGTYTFQNSIGGTIYDFLRDGEHYVRPVPKAQSDYNTYNAYFFSEDLTEKGKTLTVNPDGLGVAEWSVRNESGSVISVSDADYFPADVSKRITLSLNADSEFVDIGGAKLYINDTLVETTAGEFSFDTLDKSPAHYMDDENFAAGDLTVYNVRIEGVKITTGEGSCFATADYRSDVANVTASLTEKYLYDASGTDATNYDAKPYYKKGGEYYFDAADGAADVALDINFSGTLEGTVAYSLSVALTDAEGTKEAEFDLTKASFAPEINGDSDGYCAFLSDNGISIRALIYMSGGAEPDITDTDHCFQVTVCFSVAAGEKMELEFN